MTSVEKAAQIIEATLKDRGYISVRLPHNPAWRDDVIVIGCNGREIPLTSVNTMHSGMGDLVEKICEILLPFPSK